MALEGLQSDPSGAMLISYQGHTAIMVALFAIVVPLFYLIVTVIGLTSKRLN